MQPAQAGILQLPNGRNLLAGPARDLLDPLEHAKNTGFPAAISRHLQKAGGRSLLYAPRYFGSSRGSARSGDDAR